MTDPSVKLVCAQTDSVFDVVFVHGITGHAIESWTYKGKGTSEFFWPAALVDRGVPASVYTVKYESSHFGRTDSDFNLFELGKAVSEALAIEGLGNRPIAFIGHSMGGLVIKETLRKAGLSGDDEKQRIASNTRLVCFISTPHKGAAIAKIITKVAGQLASPGMTALSNDSGYLTSLNEDYRSYAKAKSVSTIAYYEKHKTNGVLLVSEEDADPGAHGCETQSIAADHIGIARPQSADSALFRSVSRHLTKACVTTPKSEMAMGGLAPDYASVTERRDLLQKLIDAGREHEYSHANDLQNRFAQRYVRLGLYSDSRQLHDEILSEVEQRFILHVYHPKICKSASDDEISAAIQSHVIDPVCEKFRAHGASAANVLEAIYFLTQQCHIRWDQP